MARGKAHVGHEVVFVCILFNTHHVIEADMFCMPHLQCIHTLLLLNMQKQYIIQHTWHTYMYMQDLLMVYSDAALLKGL